MKNSMIILICVLILAGCSGKQCIKVGGSYDGIDGNVEYCWDGTASDKAGVPVLKDSKGSESLILSKDSLADMLGETPSTKSLDKYSRLKAYIKGK